MTLTHEQREALENIESLAALTISMTGNFVEVGADSTSVKYLSLGPAIVARCLIALENTRGVLARVLAEQDAAATAGDLARQLVDGEIDFDEMTTQFAYTSLAAQGIYAPTPLQVACRESELRVAASVIVPEVGE